MPWELVIGIAGTLVAALGVASAVFLGRKQLSRKRLSRSLQVTRLVSVHSEARDRITINFEGDQIKDAHLLKVRIKNAGNRPIEEADFERPLSILLGSGTPLTVEVAEAHPPELRPVAALSQKPGGGAEVQLSPLLLNSGDYLTLKIIVRDFSGQVSYDYRIVGVTELVDADRQASRRRFLAAPASSIALSLAAGLATALAVLPVARLLDEDDPRAEPPVYAQSCPVAGGGCASPLWDRNGYGIATTENVVRGAGIEGRFDPRTVAMSLDRSLGRGWLSIALEDRYSVVSGQLAVLTCMEQGRVTAEIKDKETQLFSRNLLPGVVYRFQTDITRVHFLVLSASVSLARCPARVIWSDLRFD